MSNLRLFLLLAIGLVGLQLWSAWQEDYGPQPDAERQSVTAPELPGVDVSDVPSATAAPVDLDVPSAADLPAPIADGPAAEGAPAPVAENGREISIISDTLHLRVATRGAEIRQADLPTYPVSLQRKDLPTRLLNTNPERYFIVQSGLVAADAPAPDHTTQFEVDGDRFELAAGSDVLEVPFVWRHDSGLVVRKVFRLERGSFVVGVRHEISNQTSAPWRGHQYRQMQRVPPPRPSTFAVSNPELYAFVGAALYHPEDKFKKLPFDDFVDEPYNRSFAGGWSAMQQHYFVGAWVPPATELTTYSTAVLAPALNLPQRYRMRQMSPQFEVPVGADGSIEARLFLGPKLQSILPDVAPGLQYTVDYGMVSFISQPLFWLMSWIYSLVGNWGVAIIVLTLLVKLAFYRLSEAQYRSMAKMRKLQPRLEQLKERYGDDRQKMAQAQMEMFKKEKVNPLGGCLPILLQLPVFFALYWVIFEAVELRQAPFILWIQDLSVKDPYYVLPVLNVAVMWYTQKLSPAPGMDPMQRKIFQTMPLIFGVLFAFFPAGLVLYWLCNGVLGLIQQLVITRRIEAKP